ncbi:DapH/DapD/GlmU-related protein [Kocuria massiliensis]|uniref:DapH/DapD/GlmU-related protein n=1 Tax=Kocuria massiliensis TaxID=1926282 RepID=UPI0022B99C06|nr:DapH/DapD/GlmU-related protein [Kocuria massiliensis]
MTSPKARQLLEALNRGEVIRGDSVLHEAMHEISQHALSTVAQLNSAYHAPHEVRALMTELTGRKVPNSVTVFPPFYSEFGANISLGERVFVNTGCTIQDQGGVVVGDDTLIGHNVLIATLNHDMDPAYRADMHPGRVIIGTRVWIGSAARIMPGVSIGDGAVVAAGALVTQDVPARTVVAGVPAKPLRKV